MSDSGNYRIKKIDLSKAAEDEGFVTNFVGSGRYGHKDGTGTEALITNGGMAQDGEGNLYLADAHNHCIRKITPGEVTTLAGSPRRKGDIPGTGMQARFNEPEDLAFGSGATSLSPTKRITKSNGSVRAAKSSQWQGQGKKAARTENPWRLQAEYPYAMAALDGKIYFSQYNNGRIRTFSPRSHFLVEDGDSHYLNFSIRFDCGTLAIDLPEACTFSEGKSGSNFFTIRGRGAHLNQALATLAVTADNDGECELTFSASDGRESTGHLTVPVKVGSSGDNHILGRMSDRSPDEDTPLPLQISARDVDQNQLRFSVAANSKKATAKLDKSGTKQILDPENNREGTAQITVTMEGQQGGSDSETFNPHVIGINAPPSDILLDNNTVGKNKPAGTKVGVLTLVDPDKQRIVKATVQAVNDAPVIEPLGTQTTKEGTTKFLSIVATDADSDTLTYSATVNSGQVTANASGNQIILTPAENWNGTASITVTASDGQANSSSSFDLQVSSVNDSPLTLLLDNDTLLENEPAGTLVGILQVPDVDNPGGYTFGIIEGGDMSKCYIQDDQLFSNAVIDFETDSTLEIVIRATDATGSHTDFPVTVFIIGNDDPQEIYLEDQSIEENQPVHSMVGEFSMEGYGRLYGPIVRRWQTSGLWGRF